MCKDHPRVYGENAILDGEECIDEDHPRVYGENSQRISRRKPLQGSPPRIRGKHEFGFNHGNQVGITPAYTGKTNLAPVGVYEVKDHPRVYGENIKRHLYISRDAGSPPRIRGKLGYSGWAGNDCRITPAYTGKTHLKTKGATDAQDHPRVYGENAEVPKN